MSLWMFGILLLLLVGLFVSVEAAYALIKIHIESATRILQAEIDELKEMIEKTEAGL